MGAKRTATAKADARKRPPHRWWIKTIHVLKGKIAWSDDDYRAAMYQLYERVSSTELNYSEAMDFIDRLKAMAENRPVPPTSERGVWISAPQRRKIESLATALGWLTPERMIDQARLNGFIMHTTGATKSLSMLLVREAQAVITGMERMYAAQQRKEERLNSGGAA